MSPMNWSTLILHLPSDDTSLGRLHRLSNSSIYIYGRIYMHSGHDSSTGTDIKSYLKEYYEIVDEARPLSGFLPTHADFFTEIHF